MTRSHRPPSLNWLRVFEAAARHANFARAAAELDVSAAAISQQISALEKYYGVPLFHRAPNRVTLTPVGADFLPTVQLALLAIEEKADTLFRSKSPSRVQVAASQLMMMSWLPQVIAEFEKNNPDVQVEMRTSHEGAVETHADIVIRMQQDQRHRKQGDLLMHNSLRVFCRPEDAKNITSIRDILNYRLIDVASHALGWRHVLLRHLAPSALDHLIVDVVDTTPWAFSRVRQGLGLALGTMPACWMLASSMGLQILSLVPEVTGTGTYELFYPNGHPRSEVQRVAAALHAAAQQTEAQVAAAQRADTSASGATDPPLDYPDALL